MTTPVAGDVVFVLAAEGVAAALTAEGVAVGDDVAGCDAPDAARAASLVTDCGADAPSSAEGAAEAAALVGVTVALDGVLSPPDPPPHALNTAQAAIRLMGNRLVAAVGLTTEGYFMAATPGNC